MNKLNREQVISLKNLLEQIDPDQIADTQPVYLQQAYEEFMMACQARKLSPNTIDDYKRSISRFIAHVGDMPMNNVEINQVSAWLGSMENVSTKTLLNRHIGLAAFWTWALKHEYANKHVVRLVDRPRPQQVVIEPFSEAEIRSLFSVVTRNPERDLAILYLLLDTGIRTSELIGLEVEDINFEKRLIKTLGKGNKERLLPFSKTTAAVLSTYLKRHPGKPFDLTRTSLAHLVFRIGKSAGVKDCHPHRFRHTFAVAYLHNGGDIYTLQEILGHSTLEMVRHYLKIAQVDIEVMHQRASPVENWHLQPREAWIQRDAASSAPVYKAESKQSNMHLVPVNFDQ